MRSKAFIQPIRYLILVLAGMMLPFHLLAQPAAIDSLSKVLQLHPAGDTVRINLLIELCSAYLKGKNDKSKVAGYLPELDALSRKINYKRGIIYHGLFNGACNFRKSNSTTIISNYQNSLKQLEVTGDKAGAALCYQFLAQAYYYIGKFEESIQYDLKSVQLKSELNDRIGVANSYNGIGSSYFSMGNYQQSLDFYLKALKISEELNDSFGISRMKLNVACVFVTINKPDDALRYMEESLKIKTEINDLEGEALIYMNMSNIFTLKKEYDRAIHSCLMAIAVSEKLPTNGVKYSTYINLGNLYLTKKRVDEALGYFLKAYEGSVKTNDKVNIIAVTASLGKCYEEKKEYISAITFYKKSLDIAKEANYKSGVKDGYSNLSFLYEKLGNYKEALINDKLLSAVKDTLLNEESMKQTQELNTRYETDKKEKEILLLTKDQLLKDKTLKEQRLVRIGLIIGLGLFLALSFLLYNRFRFKQKANLILEKQKQEIHQKNVLITDSIDYAKTIQEAILPDDEKLKTFFFEYFILYKPKAIVSGDFYWIGKKDDKIICAVADCTGHGVPGAFMSLLGHNILENVIQQDKAIDPGAILTVLNEEIVTRFSKGKERETVKHGMDIALISIDNANHELQYAGARNSLYLVRANALTEIKADKISTGVVTRDEAAQKYTNHSISIQKGDMIYLFSDGFPDQKGGPDKKKFFYQPFKDALVAVHALPVKEQQQQLDAVIMKWIGEGEQIDDILVMGIRI